MIKNKVCRFVYLRMQDDEISEETTNFKPGASIKVYDLLRLNIVKVLRSVG